MVLVMLDYRSMRETYSNAFIYMYVTHQAWLSHATGLHVSSSFSHTLEKIDLRFISIVFSHTSIHCREDNSSFYLAFITVNNNVGRFLEGILSIPLTPLLLWFVFRLSKVGESISNQLLKISLGLTFAQLLRLAHDSTSAPLRRFWWANFIRIRSDWAKIGAL